MPSDLENLKTRRSTIYTELAALSSKKTYTIEGQSVDHNAFRKSLLEELRMINELIAGAEGPWEVES